MSHRTRIKICGITREEDLRAAVENGADALGFVFYPLSPRYLAPERFAVLGIDGRPLRDERASARVRALAIPPAWTDVWIAPDADSHIQATGRDARGRKQYRYHQEWRGYRDRVKLDHLVEFGAVLPSVRRRVEHDLAEREITRDRVVATIVRLLELSLVRVGNEDNIWRVKGEASGTSRRRDRPRRPSVSSSVPPGDWPMVREAVSWPRVPSTSRRRRGRASGQL